MVRFLEKLNGFVWGAPALIGILGVGIYLSFATGFAQISLFPKAIREFLRKLSGKDHCEDGVSPYQTLCTALAATVGTGNIAGVAGAIAIGGPGAIFWMWICALFGMITKFAEATLAVCFQTTDGFGQLIGGPMYMIERGMGRRWKWLGSLYCFFGVVAACGVGNATQVNAVIDGVNSVMVSFGGHGSLGLNVLLGAVLAVIVSAMLLGGAKRVGAAAEKLVPFASCAYILLGLGVLLCRWRFVDNAFHMILEGASSPSAVTGGLLGSAFSALRVGVSRGVFTNEAGMGTASISYASAKVSHPVNQGLMGIVEVFLDTIVICTITALVILCSGVGISYGTDEGAALTSRAFSAVYGSWVSIPLALFLACFAFATMLGWGMYGARCAQYIFGSGAWKPFVYLQAVIVAASSLLQTGTVWTVAEIMNGLMAIPNLIVLAVLSPVLVRLVQNYTENKDESKVRGGTYESFHQCQSLRTLSHEKIPSSCSGCGEEG